MQIYPGLVWKILTKWTEKYFVAPAFSPCSWGSRYSTLFPVPGWRGRERWALRLKQLGNCPVVFVSNPSDNIGVLIDLHISDVREIILLLGERGWECPVTKLEQWWWLYLHKIFY